MTTKGTSQAFLLRFIGNALFYMIVEKGKRYLLTLEFIERVRKIIRKSFEPEEPIGI